jgi:hypothetical protein
LREDVEIALTANNASDTDPLAPHQENSILVSGMNPSNIDASAGRQNTPIDEFDDDSTQLSGSSDGMSIIGSEWSLDPAAIWDPDEDPDAAIYTTEFEITMTFEKTADGLYSFLTVTIESIESAVGDPIAVLSAENAAQQHYCIENPGTSLYTTI